jgi:RNA polymerase sigma factor (sigma-70 family)
MGEHNTTAPPGGPSGSLAKQIRVLTVKLRPYLHRLESRYSLDPADSADLEQEALMAFAMHRAEIRNPLAWLLSVLRRGCARLLRLRSSGAVSLDSLDADRVAGLAVTPAAELENQAQLEEIVSELSPRNQRVLWMRFVAGMNWREIAEELGCKTSSAKKAVFRAVAAARDKAASL